MGPMDDTAANAIRACDPNGALMMYVSRMVPTCEKSCFYAFGPVFSGTIETRQKVRIQGLANQSAWCSWWARPPVRIAHVPSGNPVALVGVDQLLLNVWHFDVHRRCAQHCGHDVQCLSRREGGCQTDGRTGPAEVGRGFEEALEVGSVGRVHHRGEWSARDRWLWRALHGELFAW